MLLLLTPVLTALGAARDAAGDAVRDDDEVTMDDQGDRFVIEFVATGDVLGGGARVVVLKDTVRVLNVFRGQ